jgi:hypothetical protein
MDHDGKFPPSLDVLESEGHLASLDDLRYKERKVKHDWIYFPGRENTDAPDIILFAAPAVSDPGGRPRRIICCIDGSSRPVPEADFQRRIRDQGDSVP